MPKSQVVYTYNIPMNRKRYTADLISQTLMAGDQLKGVACEHDDYDAIQTEDVCLMSNTILVEAINNKIEKETAWTDKLRYLDEFEILRAVFKYVDVRNLKACRLVNKLWNVEACTALRFSSYVRLFENQPKQLNYFRMLISNIQLLGTPSPFERYHFSSSQLRSENMDMILFDNKSYVENFYVHESPLLYKSEFQRHLYQILMKDAQHLKVFHCALADGICFSLVGSYSRLKLYLPALEEFGFWEKDYSAKPGCISFIVEVIHGSPNLKHFHPKILNDKSFGQILRRTDLKLLENLYIQSINSGHLHLLLKFQMPNLKALNLQINGSHLKENKVSSELLQHVVQMYAETLEDLSISWPSNTPDLSFPTCPKLQHIIIDDWMGSLGIFDLNIVPELKSIHKIYNTEFSNQTILSPHPGVESFAVEYRIRENHSPHMDFLQCIEEEYTYFFEYIFYQYPNLQCLDVSLPISNGLVTSILRTFPNLQVLAIENTFSWAYLNEHVFTGINKYTLKQHLELNGKLIDHKIRHPRMPSFVDMKRLKKLVLARYNREGVPSHMMLTNNAIKYGIARMPKLEFLQINWNPELSSAIFSESLAHLSKIVITDAFRFQPFKVLTNLKKLMPRIEFQ